MKLQNDSTADTVEARDLAQACPPGFIALERETRTHVPTKVMCHHLGRKEQTARIWACSENGPLRPIRIHGRLAWPVADIRRILGVALKVEV